MNNWRNVEMKSKEGQRGGRNISSFLTQSQLIPVQLWRQRGHRCLCASLFVWVCCWACLCVCVCVQPVCDIWNKQAETVLECSSLWLSVLPIAETSLLNHTLFFFFCLQVSLLEFSKSILHGLRGNMGKMERNQYLYFHLSFPFLSLSPASFSTQNISVHFGSILVKMHAT